MSLANKSALFHLSEAGKDLLRGLVPDGDPFEAFVMREDEIGAWIMAGPGSPPMGVPSVPVTLIKWEYVKSVNYEHLIGGTDSGTDEILLI
jgi:hypothetical protein